MTEQKAVDRLELLHYKILHTSFNNKVYASEMKAFVMAKESLKKQIVKPPKFETLKGGFVQKRCVVCGNKILPFYAKYCSDCGQRLE